MKRGHKNKIALVFGTRPEIIKLSPVIRALQSGGQPFFMIHTGQHYSYALDHVFFRDLDLPEPTYRLSERSKGAHGDHTGRMMIAIEHILVKEKPSIVLVQGDTNSVLAGSLAAAKMDGIRLGHVEAGLRSYDRTMPEEVNRIVSDHVSDFLFAPTPQARSILLREGIRDKKIHVTGNTIVDAVRQSLKLARNKISVARWLGRKKQPFFLMTLHRQENVDFKNRLCSIFDGVGRVAERFRVRVLFPIHPRTAGKIKQFGLKVPVRVELLEPVGFLEFLRLEEEAQLLLSDSGGVQEEGCILRVPCVTLRTSTERPETVRAGANVVAGREPQDILRAAERMIARRRNWPNPFGDGRAGQRIARILS